MGTIYLDYIIWSLFPFLFRGRLKVGHEILGKTEHLYRNVYLHESEFGETLTDNADGNTELN